MERSLSRWYPLVLAVIVVGVYANSLQGGHFILDDEPSILKNLDIHQILPLWRAPEVVSNPAVNNRPVVRLSLALNYAWGEFDIRGYRLFNLGIHLLCGLTLYGVVRHALRSAAFARRYDAVASDLAFAVALIWLVHPLQTQCVNHTIQRSTSLMALCYLLTLFCVQRGIDTNKRLWYAIGVGACVLGMGCKEAMATAPVAILLYDRTFAAGTFRRALEKRWQLYLGLASTWGLLAFLMAQNSHGASIDMSQPYIIWHYALNQSRIILEHYVANIFWPDLLTNFYGPIRYVRIADVWPFSLALCSLLIGTAYALVRYPVIGFAGGWFFLLLAPTSSIAAIFWEAMAERRPYLAIASVLALVVVAGYSGLARWVALGGLSPRSMRWICSTWLVVVVVGLGGRTMVRNQDYLDLVTLWRGEAEYVESVIKSLDLVLVKVAWYHADVYIQLAQAYAEQEKWEQAQDLYTQILQANPNNFKAHKWQGYLYKDRDMPDEAIYHFRRVVALNPDAYAVHNALGALLCMQGAVDEGIGHLQRAVQIAPTYVWGYSNLGAALKLQQRDEEARLYLDRALQIAPNFSPALENLVDLRE